MRLGCWLRSLTTSAARSGVHGLAGGVEPDYDGVLLVVLEEFLDLGDGLFVQVVVEGAILRGVPVAGVLVVIAATAAAPPGAVQSCDCE